MRPGYEGLHTTFVCVPCSFSIRRSDHIGAVAHDQPEDDMLRQIVKLRDVHANVCEDLRWLHHSAGESMDVRRGRIMRGKGMCAGILDLEWPYFRLREGVRCNGLAIELKYGKAMLTAQQRDRAQWLEDQGWVVRVCRSVDEAWAAIRSYAGWPEGACQCTYCAIADQTTGVANSEPWG